MGSLQKARAPAGMLALRDSWAVLPNQYVKRGQTFCQGESLRRAGRQARRERGYEITPTVRAQRWFCKQNQI